jgi:class 3 adenylate cyclase
MRQNKCYLLSMLFLWVPVFLLAQFPELPSPVTGNVGVQKIYILVDSAGAYDMETVRQMPLRDTFSLRSPAEILPTQAPLTYWMAFRMANTSDSLRKYFLDFEWWPYVDVYGTAIDGRTVRHTTGHLAPFRQRVYPLANRNLVPLELPPGEAVDYLVKLTSDRSARAIPVDLQFQVRSPEEIRSWELNMTGLVMFFTGIFLVMFFYHLFVYFSTRDADYLFYLLFLFVLINIPAHNFGYSVQYLGAFDGFSAFVHKLDVIFSFALGITMLIFANVFFKTRERTPWLWRISLVVIALSALCFLPMLQGNVVLANTLIGNISLAGILVILVIAFHGWYKGYPSAMYFVIAQIFFVAGGLITVLAIVKAIPGSAWTDASVPAGAAIQNILLSFALANKLNLLRKENEASQLKIIHQMEENKKLQDKVNRELEQKVRERTKELDHVNGQLQTTNQELSQTLQLVSEERRKSDRLLLNILPETTATELKEKGAAAPRYYKLVSVLFADFAGFSHLASRLSPEEIVRYLNFYFLAFDEIIDRHGIEKIKTIGDAYMCAGGVPLANVTNPVDTVMAAMEMQAFVLASKDKIRQESGVDWDLRIGVHSGELVAGVVGAKKFAYDIWGDTVNVAARLEEKSLPGRVNISAATYELVKDHFECSYRGEIQAKNINLMGMYFVEKVIENQPKPNQPNQV